MSERNSETSGFKHGPLVYVAGPYGNHLSLEQREFNLRLADMVAQSLVHEGFAPFVPHKQSNGWQRGLTGDQILEVDFIFLSLCDGLIAIVRDGDLRTGVAAEMALARLLGKPVTRLDFNGSVDFGCKTCRYQIASSIYDRQKLIEHTDDHVV